MYTKYNVFVVYINGLMPNISAFNHMHALELGCAATVRKNFILYSFIFIKVKMVRKIIFVNINLKFLIPRNQ